MDNMANELYVERINVLFILILPVWWVQREELQYISQCHKYTRYGIHQWTRVTNE